MGPHAPLAARDLPVDFLCMRVDHRFLFDRQLEAQQLPSSRIDSIGLKRHWIKPGLLGVLYLMHVRY
jgi:hypothetical protein